MKTSKVVKYVTTDGKEFIGLENRHKAISHEKYITDMITRYDKDLVMLKILKQQKGLDHVNREMIINDSQYEYDEDQTIADTIEELLIEGRCSSDLDGLDEMFVMITDVVDGLGGINVVKNICTYTRKHIV
jgi:hypothetical protein